ncbi:DsrE family protein [Wenzhouxiangella sp. AB-CW3]|uniref:DsrE family protein n=1 Tax=Wenzhouxiangella sp. AB-CW3 TaxID=2771012 RepID=UPI00168B1147|nr:DsrE family protein [Wenzhouxiangella sp. AB-CW3]QOC21421.1 DsrE family protein [Wenzhouxiangella sp. AB-CW3]
MKRFTAILIGLTLAVLLSANAQADQHGDDKRLFVSVTGSAAQDRAMPLVLANQALDQGAQVRVLLCGAGGEIAVADHELDALAPRGLTPRDLLNRLIQHEVTVEVCAIFLPNTDYTEDDLIDGVGVANPGDVAAWMMAPGTRLFSN